MIQTDDITDNISECYSPTASSFLSVKAKKVCFSYPSNMTIDMLKDAVTVPLGDKPALTIECKGIIASESEKTLYVFSTKQIGHRELDGYPFYSGQLKNWHANGSKTFEPCKTLVKGGVVIFEPPTGQTQSFKSPLQRKQTKKAAFKIERSTKKEEIKEEEEQEEEVQEDQKDKKKLKINEDEVLEIIVRKIISGLSFLDIYKEYLESYDFRILRIMLKNQHQLERHQTLCSEIRQKDCKETICKMKSESF